MSEELLPLLSAVHQELRVSNAFRLLGMIDDPGPARQELRLEIGRKSGSSRAESIIARMKRSASDMIVDSWREY